MRWLRFLVPRFYHTFVIHQQSKTNYEMVLTLHLSTTRVYSLGPPVSLFYSHKTLMMTLVSWYCQFRHDTDIRRSGFGWMFETIYIYGLSNTRNQGCSLLALELQSEQKHQTCILRWGQQPCLNRQWHFTLMNRWIHTPTCLVIGQWNILSEQFKFPIFQRECLRSQGPNRAVAHPQNRETHPQYRMENHSHPLQVSWWIGPREIWIDF